MDIFKFFNCILDFLRLSEEFTAFSKVFYFVV